LAFVLNEDLLRHKGLVAFGGEVVAAGIAYPLTVLYPPGFPFVRPEVISPTTQLSRHQHPYARNLCLIENSPAAWSSSMTGANMVQQAVRLLADSHSGPAAVHANEVDAPEPRSVYYPYTAHSSLVIPENMQHMPSGSSGQAWLTGFDQAADARGLLNKLVMHENGQQRVAEAPAGLRNLFSGATMTGLWIKVDSAPPWFGSYPVLRAWVKQQAPDFERRVRRLSSAPGNFGWNKALEVLAVCYPEEGPARGEVHDTWLTAVRWETNANRRGEQILRPHLVTEQARFVRTPQLAALRGKRVAVIGLGTLGAEIAVRLGRAGVSTFYLVDYDLIEFGNQVRHESDLRDVGLPKVEVITRRLHAINPYVRVESSAIRLGGFTDIGRPEEDVDQLGKFAANVCGYDLLVGATGDSKINHLLNRIGQELHVPLLYCWTMSGAWGGEVLRTLPGETACYECMALQERDGMLSRVPQEDPVSREIFPLGCGFPTFTGAGFDTGSVALLATRLAVQTLLREHPDAYPDAPYHYLLWDSRGSGNGAWPDLYRWTIPRHPECSACGAGRT
jgi:molybdopterin/thiamine biosynthesis adenylyltransferase